FVDDCVVQAANKAHRIRLRRGENRLIVERDIGSVRVPHFSNERGLAGPARAYDQDHRRIQKGLLRPTLDESLVHTASRVPTIGSMRHDNWKSIARGLEGV